MSNTKSGKIGVTTENIFPIIKKFLYSEHDIFIRELVSNAVDATQKLQTIARLDSTIGELGDLAIRIEADKEAGTLTITDRGIGMDADEIEKYINQIAFSGAEDFLKNYKESAPIIGHFGLGFYSAFMVAKKVEIDTLSYKKGAKAVHWSCDGSPEFELSESPRSDRGTTIILHMDEDGKQFLEKNALEGLLRKYCHFLPIPILFGKKEEWKEGKTQETDEDNQINDTNPLWMKTPAEIKDEKEYLHFYRSLYPMSEEPLFHIHLNVDYPFTLKGILYFPKLKEGIEPQRNRIQLFCNQVFVTDQVEGIVPEWLTLLEGVLDSPDIPLNVSRSYLQQDSEVKKITNHISKKVADTLADLFRKDRKTYEEKWESIGLFVQYGMLTEDKTYDRLKPVALLKDIEGKYYTIEDYRTLIADLQTNKEGRLTILYATNPQEQYLSVERAKQKGYNVLHLEGPLSLPFINMLEGKEEQVHFARVDSDTIERLIAKEDTPESKIAEEESALLEGIFQATAPLKENHTYHVEVDHYMADDAPATEITTSEWMRRMKEMSRYQNGMNFYGSMPDSYVLKVNPANALIKKLLASITSESKKAYEEIASSLEKYSKEQEELVKSMDGKKEDELSAELKDQRKQLTENIDQLQAKKKAFFAEEAKKLHLLPHLWDLALIAANLLQGERLQNFIRRSEELLG